LRGKLAIIAVSAVLLLGNIALYTIPAYGGGFPVVFDGGPTGNGQDWFTGENWNPDFDFLCNYCFFEIGSISPGPPFFNVNIGDGTSPGVIVTIGDTGSGSLEIFDQNSLTIKEFSTLNHIGIIALTITVNNGATLTIDGILNNGIASPEDATININGPTGKIVITSTGVLNHDFGSILGDGEIECVGGGTFNENAFVAGTITITGCGGAPVGSISIPIDSTSLLVAESQSFSWMLPVVLSVLGIGLFVVSRKSENSKI